MPPTTTAGPGHDLALRPLLALAALVTLVLIALAGGYGYHRDELYFLAAGHHLAWSYADQGPLTPLIARAMDGIAPGSLVVLRIPPALMTGGTVAITGLIAHEFGADRRAQLIAAGSASVASIVLITGHLLSTTTFDLFAWALVTWLIVRAIRTDDGRLWLGAGLVTGLALLNKPLIPFLGVALGVGLLTVGPRRTLKSKHLWAGVALALVIWSPWIIWQSSHGWPQLDVSSSIASGGSTSSQPRWALVPFQFLLVSPVLAPVWIAGLVALLRRPELEPYRSFGVAWFVLVVIFLATGGKPYYLAGMFPVMLATGSIPTGEWLDRGPIATRRRLLRLAFVTSAAVSLLLALPILPAKKADPVIAVNPDVGETIGWPQFARTVATVYRGANPATNPVILTRNYGEAGAIDRYGPDLRLPTAYSGHNAFGDWGPPPDRPAPVIAIGLPTEQLRRDFTGCRLKARISNTQGIDNDEHGVAVEVCAGTRRPWSKIWTNITHLG